MAEVQKTIAPKAMASLMIEKRKFPAPKTVQKKAYIKSFKQYQEMWEKSIKDPTGFWLEEAKTISWFTEPTKGLEYTWDTKSRKIEHTWFADGILNVSYNCLDRDLGTPTAKKVAILFQGKKIRMFGKLPTSSFIKTCANSQTF